MSSVWDGFRGHEDVLAAFRHARRAGRLSQAYLLVGLDGIGKFEFARRLAQVLLCQQPPDDLLEACGTCIACRPYLAGAHPDFHLVQRESGKRELTVDKFLGPPEQRGKAGLCHDLAMRPLASSRKVAIIRDAEAMNDESANALLKTLEEPPAGTVLLLTATNLDLLLPTIRSRCQITPFRPLSNADVAALLVQTEAVASLSEALPVAELAGGSFTAAQQMASAQWRTLRNQLLQALSRGSFGGQQLARELFEGIEELASDTAEQRVAAIWLIRTAVEFFRQSLWRFSVADAGAGPSLGPETQQWASQWQGTTESALDWLGDAIDRSLTAVAEIEQNVAVGLSLAAWLSAISPRSAAA